MTVVGKSVWFALWAAVAVAAAGFEMDREARHDASLAARVPAPFRGFALEVLARGALARGDSAAGVQLAREMVSRRPIPAEGLAMMAQGELAAGREQPALAAVMVAAERGWRDSFTQAIVVQLAVQGGDWDIAGQRLLALWRKGEQSDELRALSGAVLSRQEGLTAFTAQLRAEAGWSNALLLWSASALDAHKVGVLAGTLRKNGAQLDCPSLSASASDSIRFGRGAAVEALWLQACGRRRAGASASGLGNLVFTSNDESAAGPFDWHYLPGPGVEQAIEAGAGGPVLRFSNSEPIRQPIARRFAMLPPGARRVSATGDAVKSSMSRGPALEVTCFDGQGAAHTLGKFDLTPEGASFSLPAGCASQWLTIDAGMGAGTIDRVRID
ncbi:tetratricopeptide repeat protein [Novosphingobium clariflavum]|uniref:Uncharacterized protein n=1 Tax=Novosphingobium clariflavum TaxID=2029884 RepID=A0ABV6S821_9SPHN|nr:hypothetical protein [Novosphingobium clariflavum]